MIDDIIIEELDRLELETPWELSGHSDYEAGIIQGRMEIINSLRQFIKPIPEDPVRDDLEQKAKEIATKWKAQGVPYNAIHEAVREMLSFQWQAYVPRIWKLSSANYEKGKEEMKQQMIVKAYEWIKLLSDTHYIMHYSDCCEVTLVELKDWFKSYMED